MAAVAALWCASERDGEPLDAERLREALASFEGVKRRFEFYVNTPRQVYMDDYAHHPRELAAAITSVKKMFPGRRLTALFQPHLYTRTRDFYREFAEALSHADRVVLLPIYPAREEPIPGVESEMIGRLLTVPWTICDRAELAEKVAAMDTDVVVSFGQYRRLLRGTGRKIAGKSLIRRLPETICFFRGRVRRGRTGREVNAGMRFNH